MPKQEITSNIIPVLPTSVTLPRKASTADVNAVFQRLRQLIKNCGIQSNKHDIVCVVIHACIQEGMDTERRIIGTVKHLGYTKEHAYNILNEGIGHRWAHDENGKYRNLM